MTLLEATYLNICDDELNKDINLVHQDFKNKQELWQYALEKALEMEHEYGELLSVTVVSL